MTTYPYSYDELLFKLHNAKIADDIYTKINLPPLQVHRKNKLSIFVNINTYSEKLNRTKEHISNFFREEMGTATSINGQNQLIIHGILNEAKCESIMRKYIKQYVMCKQCKSIHSTMIKDNGLTYLECKQCFAKTSLGKL